MAAHHFAWPPFGVATLGVLPLPAPLVTRMFVAARAISRLNHPHVCTLYDIGHAEGVTNWVQNLP